MLNNKILKENLQFNIQQSLMNITEHQTNEKIIRHIPLKLMLIHNI